MSSEALRSISNCGTGSVSAPIIACSSPRALRIMKKPTPAPTSSISPMTIIAIALSPHCVARSSVTLFGEWAGPVTNDRFFPPDAGDSLDSRSIRRRGMWSAEG